MMIFMYFLQFDQIIVFSFRSVFWLWGSSLSLRRSSLHRLRYSCLSTLSSITSDTVVLWILSNELLCLSRVRRPWTCSRCLQFACRQNWCRPQCRTTETSCFTSGSSDTTWCSAACHRGRQDPSSRYRETTTPGCSDIFLLIFTN